MTIERNVKTKSNNRDSQIRIVIVKKRRIEWTPMRASFLCSITAIRLLDWPGFAYSSSAVCPFLFSQFCFAFSLFLLMCLFIFRMFVQMMTSYPLYTDSIVVRLDSRCVCICIRLVDITIFCRYFCRLFSKLSEQYIWRVFFSSHVYLNMAAEKFSHPIRE